MLSSLDLKNIALAGGGLIIDGSKYSSLDIKGIALALKKDSAAQMVVKNASKMSALDIKGIALAGQGHVVFDFT